MKTSTTSKLKRPKQSMPQFVRSALISGKMMNAYKERPPYQQNDYLSWIKRAKMEQTRQKRLGQMLSELKQGGLYMKMNWRKKR